MRNGLRMAVLAVGVVWSPVGLLGANAVGHGRNQEERRTFRDVEPHGLLSESRDARDDHEERYRHRQGGSVSAVSDLRLVG